ncbi:hypothetical protein [Mycobacterium palustre]|uniref:hypothetical protein n=1 Tax=Mycobacterium palustre TaxID=153971 RepID=UPI000A15D6EE|nr:hypothetical protein [Mycobacterium palustre]MCV7100736.1 hypothetical protein [Mycobacterium palustre]
MTTGDESNIIDVEAEEIEESKCLPAVIAHEASNSEHIELPNRQDALLADNPDRRCVATNSRGERCRKFAIYGSTVCRTHGGATRHVANKARIRVQMASNRLMGKLIDFAFDDTKPPDVQLRAIRDALDRSGLKPPAEVVLAQGEPAQKPYETVFDAIGGNPDESSPASRLAESLDASRASDYDGPAGSSSESFAQGDIFMSDQPPNLHTQPTPEPDTLCPRTYPEGSSSGNTGRPAGQHAAHSSDNGPLGQAERHEFDRDAQPQGRQSARPHRTPARREVHITGMAAIQLANQANRAAGVFDEQRAIESGGHVRYRAHRR